MNVIHEEQYDLSTTPPLIVIRNLILSREDVGWTGATIGVVDSGADLSLVPVHLIDKILKSVPTQSVTVTDISGIDMKWTAVLLDCQIGGGARKSVLFAVSPGKETIVGRDILNDFHVVLDGKPCSFGSPTICLSE